MIYATRSTTSTNNLNITRAGAGGPPQIGEKMAYMKQHLMEKEIKLAILTHDIYGHVDELRQQADDLVDKIQDMVVDLYLIKSLSKELYNDEDYVFENVLDDYIGWCSDFEDLRRYIEEKELNI